MRLDSARKGERSFMSKPVLLKSVRPQSTFASTSKHFYSCVPVPQVVPATLIFTYRMKYCARCRHALGQNMSVQLCKTTACLGTASKLKHCRVRNRVRARVGVRVRGAVAGSIDFENRQS